MSKIIEAGSTMDDPGGSEPIVLCKAADSVGDGQESETRKYVGRYLSRQCSVYIAKFSPTKFVLSRCHGRVCLRHNPALALSSA